MPSTIAFNLRGQGTQALELDLFESIGGDPLFGGGITAQSVLDALNENRTAKSVLVRINSAGGIVTEGLAIYNLLRSHKGEVTCRVDGLAGSIASVIAMAGRLEMPASSYLMIHNPWGWIEGGADELRHQAQVLESMREMMLDIYCAKCGRGRDFIGSMMDEEKWMTGTEALAYGLCDALIPAPNAKLAAHFDLSRFKNTPRAIDTAPRAETQGSYNAPFTLPKDGSPALTEAQPTDTAVVVADVTIGDPATDEITVTDTPAAIAAASGATTMDEQVYKDQIAALEATVAELKAKLDGETSARAKAEADAAEAKAKFPKKGAGDDDEDEDDEEMAAAKAVMAHVKAITGRKETTGLVGALTLHIDKIAAKQSTKTVAQRVSALIAAGKLVPSRKAEFLALTAADLDVYEMGIGEAKLIPIGEEHTPDDEHAKVQAARAAAKPVAFDPDAITLDASERAVVKQMGANDPQLAERMLTEKRAQAKAEHAKKFGGSAAA